MTETLTTPRPGTPRPSAKPLLADRIPPRQVLDAYRETGRRPKRRIFFEDNGMETRACALTAIAEQKAIHADRPFTVSYAEDFGAYVMGIVDLPSDYLFAFMHGFDGLAGQLSIRRTTGYRDGARAAQFCFGEKS